MSGPRFPASGAPTPPAPGPTQRCPVCNKLNRVPLHGTGKARCGACRAPLTPASGPGSASGTGDRGRQVIQRWDELLRLVPKGMALGQAVGRGGAGDPAADPVGWLSTATHMPRADLDEVRMLRIHLASNKAAPDAVVTRALKTLDKAHFVLRRTRLPE